jgi:hypothetical protein
VNDRLAATLCVVTRTRALGDVDFYPQEEPETLLALTAGDCQQFRQKVNAAKFPSEFKNIAVPPGGTFAVAALLPRRQEIAQLGC